MRIQPIAKAVKSLRKPGCWRPLAHFVAPSYEHEKLLSRYRYDTIIDVGANRGQFSLLARMLNPAAAIYAFEPHPAAAATYRKLLPDISLREIAITDAPGQVTLHLAADSDNSSTLPFVDETSAIVVQAETLDRVLTHDGVRGSALLKIDVQGAEMRVLAGAQRTLPLLTHILAELTLNPTYAGQPHAHEVISWLAEREFTLSAIDSFAVSDGATVGFDGLFVNTVADSLLGH